MNHIFMELKNQMFILFLDYQAIFQHSSLGGSIRFNSAHHDEQLLELEITMQNI